MYFYLLAIKTIIIIVITIIIIIIIIIILLLLLHSDTNRLANKYVSVCELLSEQLCILIIRLYCFFTR